MSVFVYRHVCVGMIVHPRGGTAAAGWSFNLYSEPLVIKTQALRGGVRGS